MVQIGEEMKAKMKNRTNFSSNHFFRSKCRTHIKLIINRCYTQLVAKAIRLNWFRFLQQTTMMMVLARRIEQFGLFNFILIPIYHTCWLLCGNRLMNSFIYQGNTHNCLNGRGANAPNFKVLIEPVRMHLSYCLNRISQEIGAFDNKHTPIIVLPVFGISFHGY